ncbi:transporter substrate-binding domain-containing protein (plasmid) [Rhizobium ruizarguesonis]|jgi:NitT/TauT family transport system substrate-binding protein|uniref:Transporter substrate-binding domain-containing protein n=1 Tax=Rhizobium ruizarguesonis TaxID=2081791 RepID=A0ABY1X175_9HYPH|nr:MULTISPECIES: ABC transporter substrate-binding protein [Rhizobium]NEJ21455.1 transporter substrate-binding domain-containing protein [Rhizobium leguminosarum]MCB2401173.1 ABC transporter substrate-binding protein [Rhizobium ruizarguesonis]NEH28751.1 transporter substrate-binding domain-containing protein [Rhizobium ruizarguesonis]NEH62571.1 transporter substrate-binding domain-containing protein [Rhizobium ruizarguesonis]NEI21749.1 ABC transporter substrate-binding protein [Rhizobium ruiza
MRKLILALAATVAFAGSAFAEPVRISVGSYNLNNLPFPVAAGLGLYEKEGLEVTVENFASGGSKTLQALVAGSTDIAVGFYDHTIQMQSQNKAVVGFVQLARNSGLVLAGGKNSTFDPTKPETIKGAKIGITAPGSSSDFFVRYYLQRNNLSADDISLIGVGSGAAAVAALEQGKVDLLVNYDPAATFIEAKGVGKILIDARSDEGAKEIYGGIYPTSVLYATQAYIDENPETIQKVTTATVKALAWMNTHSAEEIVDKLPKEFISGDRDTYVKAVQNAKPIFSVDGKFSEADTQTPLAVLKSFNEKVAAATIDLSKTYTNAFVDKVMDKTTN